MDFNETINDQLTRSQTLPLFKYLSLDKKSIYPVIIAATMSSGKSTLINALAGTDLLPRRNQACTSKAIAILDNDHMKQFGAHLIDQQGRYSFIPDLVPYAVKDYNETNNFLEILIEGNIKGIHNNLKSMLLIDTPGINNCIDSNHTIITKNILEIFSEGLIVYIIDVRQIGTDDDNSFLKFIAQKVNQHPELKILFVVNKADLIDPEKENIEHIILTCKNYIEDKGIEHPVISPVSAYAALLLKKVLNQISLTQKEQNDFFAYIDLFQQKEQSVLNYCFNDFLLNTQELISINGTKYKCSQLYAALQNTGLPLLEYLINETMIYSLHFIAPKVTYKKDLLKQRRNKHHGNQH